ncbi:hypothetical protein [Catenuloplanes atrovinosus]|uniref:Uncharacterized protein n=1 Tax=Catenuloplanes atrovinosus TaxID=137266 RepID=A0AAE4C7Y4_9ACTN|nr:hypothetical protein [Catenuloplanes atrovinosus]MDR7274408.1 hypothetical protein [Catenuloplanes atrovinosus]
MRSTLRKHPRRSGHATTKDGERDAEKHVAAAIDVAERLAGDLSRDLA